ncbi:monocopper oxidase-like protein SKS1, partial [Impatiens glandulifera]|uniref:monocopper oxidase-like protein SKS1 n=1 Tax=Impatiens glandulifera TaxID=253017 RepID=UPI001FB06EEC
FVNPDTPLKLADHFNISGVFQLDSIPSVPSNGPANLSTSVVNSTLHDFIEIVFQNDEDNLQSWHLNGHDFWVVGYGSGQWSNDSRQAYNLVDATTRHTVQVFQKSWTAIMVSLDNQGMWNLRSAKWERQYLGHQLYLRVFSKLEAIFRTFILI